MQESIVGKRIKITEALFFDRDRGIQIRLPQGLRGTVLKVTNSPPQVYAHFIEGDTEIICWVHRQFTELVS